MPRSRQTWIVALCLWSAVAVAHDVQWSALAGKIGPYSGIRTADDAKLAAQAGFNLTVQSAYDPVVLKLMSDLGIRYFDIRLWSLVYAQCKNQFDAEAAAGQRRRCVLEDESRGSIMHDAEAHLREVKSNQDIVGYWILDDYPAGDVSIVLNDLHDLVERIDEESGTRKPTICGIGGSLDHRSEKNPRLQPDRTYIEASLSNLSPRACDIIAPYFYGSATQNDAAWIDWSMSDLMPWFLRELKKRGFDRPVLLPVLQAFSLGKRGGQTYYVQPRAQDIDAQARGYCQSGALAMMFFTWQSNDAERSYSNDPDIRRGVASAVSTCRTMNLGSLP